MQIIAKMYQGTELDQMLTGAESLIWDDDRFKQRAGAEVLAGLLHGMLVLCDAKLLRLLKPPPPRYRF